MIGYLRGLLLEKTAESVLLDVTGVGYHVEVPASTLCLLPSLNEPTSLYVATYVREDAIRLFGFYTQMDKQIFLSLINVSGVGPKAALALLGPLDGPELGQAILHQELTKLTSIPGIGLKTAERLVLELKTKLQKIVHRGTLDPQGKQNTSPQHQTLEDLRSALQNLGYKDKQISDVVHSIDKRISLGEQIQLEVALKLCLKSLSEHVLKH